MICPHDNEPLTMFGHGYLGCIGPWGCERVYVIDDGNLVDVSAEEELPQGRPEATVKRATLWDGVSDTYQTETELNGLRASQGALL